jgi:hypothetical protein
MPIGEIETHPYLQEGLINGATKLILGSFPVYECTNPDNELKLQNRQNEGTARFFYGIVDSTFWSLYAAHIDNNIQVPPNPNAILLSLTQRQIAIADNIFSCQRHEFSSEDTKLVQKTWNRLEIINLLQNGVTKILCTSKGVLSDLQSKIICPAHSQFGIINVQQSTALQTNLINQLGGNIAHITYPIARTFIIGNRTVNAIAIPSPGSPQRQLKQFGFAGNNWQQYANNYFSTVFNWLVN